MTKLSLYSLITCLLFVLSSGCSFDPRYEAEKAYWHARKLDRTLHKENPDGLKEEHYEQIIAALNKVSVKAPFEILAAQAQFQIAQIYLGLEKREQAHGILKETFFRFSSSENKKDRSSENVASQALFWSGQLYEQKGEIEKAQEAYMTVMKKYPLTNRGLQVPIYIIQYYKNQGDMPKMKEASSNARSHYQNLIEKYSGTSIEEQIQRYSLQVYAQEEAWDDILDFWDTEINTEIERSGVIRAKVAKANLLASQMKNLPEAEAIYKDLIDQYPFEPITPFLRVRLGYLQSTALNTEEARKTFQQILNDFPENQELIIQSRVGLASVDAREGNYEEALKQNMNLFAEYPNHPTTLKIPFTKYLYYKRTGKEESEVEQALEEAMKEYSSRWERGGYGNTDQIAGRLLFVSLIQKKEWDAAAIHLTSFSKRFPNDQRFAQLSKALYWKSSSNPAQALQLFFDPSSASPLFESEESPVQDIEETFVDPMDLDQQ